jgi:hypothetical protein
MENKMYGWPMAYPNPPRAIDAIVDRVIGELLEEKFKKKDDGDKEKKDKPIKLDVVEMASIMMLIHVPIIWIVFLTWLSK